MTTLIGATLGDRYRLLREVGAGGMGTVYEAEDTRIQRRVALKVLRVGSMPTADHVARFYDEGRVTGRLEHPNIVRVYDLGHDRERSVFYIVQELLRGANLRAHLSTRGALPAGEALDVLLPVFDALATAHESGVLHRDVKPENIFLAESGGRVTPKLIDFGVARVLTQEARTKPGVALGTLRYMAPEARAATGSHTESVDVWSAGAVLYELVAGDDARMPPPWELDPSLAAVAPSAPSALVDAVARALQPDRALRFRTMREFIAALVDAEPPTAPGGPESATPARLSSLPATPRARLLFADDDEQLRRTVVRTLAQYEVDVAADGTAALARLASPTRYDLVLTDLSMPGATGMDVVTRAVELGVPTLMLSGTGSIQTAVEVMRRGAVNYLTKPVSPDALRSAVADVLTARGVQQRATERVSEGVVGADPLFRDVLDLADVAARTDATVMLVGETGTGKDTLARLIHRLSARHEGPFVRVDVASFAPDALEVELFGRHGGGATSGDPGRIREAAGGTLFLDGVDAMPTACQSRVLRLVEERTCTFPGDSRARRVDLRILASSAPDLAARVQRGAFRAELYYRLCVVTIALPPLRERPGDVRALTERFVASASAQLGRQVDGIDDTTYDALCAYAWPGNVRELQNVVTTMVLSHRGGRLTVDNVPRAVREPAASLRPQSVVTSLPPGAVDAEGARAWLDVELVRRAMQALAGDASERLPFERAVMAEWLAQQARRQR